MSDDTEIPAPAEVVEKPAKKTARKKATSAKAPSSTMAKADEQAEAAPQAAPARDEKLPATTDASDSQAPAPDAVSSPENPKKNRRRRRKPKSGQADPLPSVPNSAASSSGSAGKADSAAPTPVPSRPRVDADQLAKFAWKIYLAEVSEEGVALIGDSDARELSRRCFKLAEIFLEEQARRR